MENMGVLNSPLLYRSKIKSPAMPTLEHQRVAILEDDPDKRRQWGAMVKLGGGVPHAPDEAPALSDLNDYLDRENISLMLCDHHLWDHDYASYSGAEALEQGYKHGCGGVLVTGYVPEDAERTIRQHRRWIPALLQPIDLNHKLLKEKLLLADQEVRAHNPPKERMPYRTIMTVRRIVQAGGDTIVKVMMSQWRPPAEVGFPINMLPEEFRAHATPGSMLIAQVNIEAERAEDLFFDNFELPNPDVLKKSRTLFGGI